jgi:hypothetical protein
MTFRLVHARYDRKTKRAYVELREEDADGGDVIITAIFLYRRTSIVTERALEQDLATKARHMMKRASVGMHARSAVVLSIIEIVRPPTRGRPSPTPWVGRRRQASPAHLVTVGEINLVTEPCPISKLTSSRAPDNAVSVGPCQRVR